MRTKLAGIAALLIVGVTGNANADTILFNNPWSDVTANCLFTTGCAAGTGTYATASVYAAQAFTLSTAAVAQSASFTEWVEGYPNLCGCVEGHLPTSANWMILNANGPGGLPGTLMFSGSSPISQNVLLPSTSRIGISYSIYQEQFNVGSLALTAGSYYLAIQAVSPEFDGYLSQGAASGGAAETDDGGATWQLGYRTSIPSVAFGLYGTLETPAAVPGLIAGAGLPGFVAAGAAFLAWKRRKTRLS